MAIIVMATAFLSSIAASLLLAVAGFALAMFGQNFFNKGYSAIVIIGLALFFIVVPPSVVISKSLLGLAQVSPSDTASRRIIDLESVISSGIEIDADTRVETTAEGRIQRYYYNYEVFMRNPLFGDSRAVSGDGHLFWAHQLAFFGIVGFSALMLILTAIVRAWLIHLKGDYRFFFWLSLGLFIAMGLMKVILGDFMFFIPLFLSPAILFYVQYQENTGKSPSANAVSNE